MADGDLCPGCDEEFSNCTCHKGTSPHTTGRTSKDDDGEWEYLYDGWYDPGK